MEKDGGLISFLTIWADDGKSAKLSEAVIQFLRSYREDGISMLPMRPFLAHMKYVEGLLSEEEAWAIDVSEIK